MIDIKELRIGNLVSYYGEIGKVRSLHEDGEVQLDFTLDEVYAEDLEPVPVDHDGVLELGLVPTYFKSNGMLAFYRVGGENGQDFITDDFRLNYFYVQLRGMHHLQNLLEDLEIKEHI
jgi:hypothetical protein